MKTKIICLLTLITSAWSCSSQGFVNLNFESANLVPAGAPFYVQWGQAFPGWTGTVGGEQQTLALSNTIYMALAGISVINSNYYNGGFIPGGVIQDHYTAILASGLLYTGSSVDTTMSQTGLIPVGTQSLLFDAFEAFDSAGSFSVTLDGQAVSLVAVSNTLNYTLFGADIIPIIV